MKRGLPCGDYAVTAGGRSVAAVERKSLTGRLRPEIREEWSAAKGPAF